MARVANLAIRQNLLLEFVGFDRCKMALYQLNCDSQPSTQSIHVILKL